jgi:hypothetical protein
VDSSLNFIQRKKQVMKDKRTEEEKSSHQNYLTTMAKCGVVGCAHSIKISPPGDDTPIGDPERCWTLLIEQKSAHGPHTCIVIAWYKTRDAARRHAKRLYETLTQLEMTV